MKTTEENRRKRILVRALTASSNRSRLLNYRTKYVPLTGGFLQLN